MFQHPRYEVQLIPAAAQAATFNSADVQAAQFNSGGMFFLNISAASGVGPTLDIKIQSKCLTTGVYHDVPGASFTQKTAAGSDLLSVHPAMAAVANKAVSQVLGSAIRAVCTIGGTTPSFTFSLTYVPA